MIAQRIGHAVSAGHRVRQVQWNDAAGAARPAAVAAEGFVKDIVRSIWLVAAAGTLVRSVARGDSVFCRAITARFAARKPLRYCTRKQGAQQYNGGNDEADKASGHSAYLVRVAVHRKIWKRPRMSSCCRGATFTMW